MATRPTGSIATIAGTAAGIVLGCAVLFGVIGFMRDGSSVEIADPAATEAASELAAPTEAATDPVTDPTENTAEPDATVDATEPEAAEPEATEPEPEPEPTETAAASTVTPGNVTVQLLDATGTGDRSTARKVADQLKAAGYNVVVVNRASKVYEATTVFWSEGQDQAGKQIAREFSFPKAEATPDEVQLSNKVNVHIVVGTDQL